MSGDGTTERLGATPPLPTSIWVVAWASLSGQVALLTHQGVRHDDELSIGLSVVLSAVLAGYVCAGVVRARIVRLVVAWVVLGLGLMGELADLVSDDARQGPLVLFSLAATVMAMAGLARFCRTDWYAWQRTRPSAHDGAAIGQLVAIGVLVGVLGALAVPVDDGLDVRISVASR